MWAVSLLQRDDITGIWRGETIQVLWWLLLVWDGNLAVSLLERDICTGLWREETIQVVWWLLLV